DIALDVAVELAFGLTFELWLGQAYADDSNKSFADVVTRNTDFVLLLLEHAVGGSEIVDSARQCRAKAGEMRATVDGVDRIGKRKNVLAIAIVILQRDFNFDGAALAFHIDRRIVERFLAAIEMLDEFCNATCEAKFSALFAALVGERDLEAFIEE